MKVPIGLNCLAGHLQGCRSREIEAHIVDPAGQISLGVPPWRGEVLVDIQQGLHDRHGRKESFPAPPGWPWDHSKAA